jgi:hypothetical protein
LRYCAYSSCSITERNLSTSERVNYECCGRSKDKPEVIAFFMQGEMPRRVIQISGEWFEAGWSIGQLTKMLVGLIHGGKGLRSGIAHRGQHGVMIFY